MKLKKRENNINFHGEKKTDGVGDREYVAEVLKDRPTNGFG